jgi:hypothetical protein
MSNVYNETLETDRSERKFFKVRNPIKTGLNLCLEGKYIIKIMIKIKSFSKLYLKKLEASKEDSYNTQDRGLVSNCDAK